MEYTKIDAAEVAKATAEHLAVETKLQAYRHDIDRDAMTFVVGCAMAGLAGKPNKKMKEQLTEAAIKAQESADIQTGNAERLHAEAERIAGDLAVVKQADDRHAEWVDSYIAQVEQEHASLQARIDIERSSPEPDLEQIEGWIAAQVICEGTHASVNPPSS